MFPGLKIINLKLTNVDLETGIEDYEKTAVKELRKSINNSQIVRLAMNGSNNPAPISHPRTK